MCIAQTKLCSYAFFDLIMIVIVLERRFDEFTATVIGKLGVSHYTQKYNTFTKTIKNK